MEANKVESLKLIESGEALSTLTEELKRIPPFKVMLQDCLQDALGEEVVIKLPVSKIHINVVAGVDPRQKEPVGRLLNVLLDCLQRGRAPEYDPALYAVYDSPNSTDALDVFQGIGISGIEKILADLVQKLSVHYVSILQQHWETVRKYNTQGAFPRDSRKAALGALQAILFARELEAVAEQGGITQNERAHISSLVRPSLAGTCYGIFIEGPGGAYVEQGAMFAVPLNAIVQDELIPGSDGAIVLYSSTRGIEKFASSSGLQRTLLQRLTSEDTREEFLQTLSINERDGFSYVPEIRYLKVHDNLFEHYSDKFLKRVYSDVAHHLDLLNKADSDFEAVISAVESVQSLVDIPRHAKSRNARLVQLMMRNAWPSWLKKASGTEQEVYVSLEQKSLESQVKYYEATLGATSFKDYARVAVEDFISQGADERIDPDTIFVNIRHTVKLADGRKVELNERKTLTQAFMYGVHDQEGRYEIVLEGFYNNPILSPANIAWAIQSLNLRVVYNTARRRLYSQADVIESMQERLGRKTALTIYGAILQKHVSPAAQDMVMRYNFGDPSIETTGVALATRFKPMKDLVVYRRKGADAHRYAHVLYAPGFPTGREWFQFPDMESLQRQFGSWAFTSEGLAYLRGQEYPSDLEGLERFYQEKEPNLMLQQWWWSSVHLTRWIEDGPLKGSVKNIIDWEADEAEVVTPLWYRNAQKGDQHLLNRLNTDFKAINQHSQGKLDIEPFHKFARNLVMKTLNDYLSRFGAHPEIDPDEVWVKFHADSKISLTNLFIQWQLWRSDVSIFEKFFFSANPFGGKILDFKEQMRSATFWTFSNQPIAALNGQVINAVIDLMPGEKYIEYLRAKFLNAPDADLKASLYRELKQNEMLRSALTQKMKGEMPQEQFDWLKSLIGGFDHDLPTGGVITGGRSPGIGVYGFTLEGRKLQGAYVFGRRINGREQLIVYVPDTFNGKDFFPAEELTTRLENSFFKENILKLVRFEHRKVVQAKLDKYKSWTPGDEPAPVLKNSYPVLQFKSEYLDMIGSFLSDVDYQTTSPLEAVWQDAKILFEFAVDVISLLVPPVGLAASLLRITHSVVQGIVASSEGDDKAANAFFATAWRGAIMLYIGKVAAVGAPVSAYGLLSNIKDISDLLSTATGVSVGISYVTAVAVPQHNIESTTRLIA
ncbi:dermonecrotic toxin domain-containing protein [Pseudomonas fluorescens]|uniref:Dermonecrotic toxin N-terminal domain-containing protein n=1 Tax=Pseudomonas fluorescens TaxID=294 RepID=A0A0F4TPX5_PSEFL|nr:DUF6543 domain-containing protein [Pseudomonas fluorescens]KJZ46508.1 hypothetical protein VC34_07290 [Pseudomonas fluorescens]